MEDLRQEGESVAPLVAPAAAPLLAPAAGDPIQPTATVAAGALNLLTAARGAGAAGQSMVAAAANSGTAAVGAGASNPSTAAASATNVIIEADTSRGKRIFVWEHFEDPKKPYRVGHPRPRVMCIYCAEYGVTGGINGSVSIMVNHLKACPFTPASVKAAVLPLEDKRNHRVRAHVALAPGMSRAMHAHLFKPMSVARYKELEKDLLKVALSCSFSFNAMQSPSMGSFLLKWVSGLKKTPTRGDLSGRVLQRVFSETRAAMMKPSECGVYSSMQMDGYKSRAGNKVMGVLAVNVSRTSGKVELDLRRTADITGVAETADLVFETIEGEIERCVADGQLARPGQKAESRSKLSVLVAVDSDSASFNVAEKRWLRVKYPTLFILACYAHQLNLLSGKIITQTCMRAVTATSSLVVAFFSRSTK